MNKGRRRKADETYSIPATPVEVQEIVGIHTGVDIRHNDDGSDTLHGEREVQAEH